jgi:hypothetical protein
MLDDADRAVLGVDPPHLAIVPADAVAVATADAVLDVVGVVGEHVDGLVLREPARDAHVAGVGEVRLHRPRVVEEIPHRIDRPEDDARVAAPAVVLQVQLDAADADDAAVVRHVGRDRAPIDAVEDVAQAGRRQLGPVLMGGGARVRLGVLAQALDQADDAVDLPLDAVVGDDRLSAAVQDLDLGVRSSAPRGSTAPRPSARRARPAWST